jgi:hypothetical protein
MRLIIASLAAALVFSAAGAQMAGSQETEITTSNWNAWVDRQPPGPAAFHLTGIVELPHAGFEVSLAPSEPQGFNPAILMMELTVTELDGLHTQAIEGRGVRYDISPYEGNLYREVSIMHQGEMIAHIGAIGVTY